MDLNNKIKNCVRFLVSILIISFFLKNLDLNKIMGIFRTSDITLIGLGLLVFFLSLLIVASGLMVLFKSAIDIKFIEWMKYFLMTYSIGMIIPGKIGEFSMAYFIRDKGLSISSSTALLIVDKIISLIIFGLIAVVGLFVLSLKQAYLMLGLVILFILGIIFIFSSYGQKFLKIMLGKYGVHFSGFFKTWSDLFQNHKSKLIFNIFITITRPILNALLIVILFKSLGYNPSLIYAILINSITIIASIIPITPNGLGVREGIGIFFFNQLGLPLEISASVYFMIFIFNSLAGLSGGIIYLLNKKKLISPTIDWSYIKEK